MTTRTSILLQILTFIVFIIIFVAPAICQISECNGKWTNGPCDGSATKVITEVPVTEPSPEESDRSRREQWLHELDMLSLEAKRKYGIVPVMGPIRDLCLAEDSLPDDCREAIQKREQELQTLMAEYAKAEAAKLAAKADVKGKGEEKTVTVIAQPPPVVYVVPRRRVPAYSTGGSSISFQADGTVGGADISVGVASTTGGGKSQINQNRPNTAQGGAPSAPQVVPVQPLPSPAGKAFETGQR